MPETDPDLLPIDAEATFGPAFALPIVEEEVPEAEADDGWDQIESDLDPRANEDFLGLLYLGRLEDECTVAGHRFLLRTPTQDDRLEMGLLHKPYLNSISTETAWRLITVSAFVRRIDSTDEPAPLTAQPVGVRGRFEWIRNAITAPMIIERLYEQCLLLDNRVRQVVEHLDRLGGASA